LSKVRAHFILAPMKHDPPREYIRHTVNVPLEIKRLSDAAPTHNEGVNISYGGLAFTVGECLQINDVIQLRIPTVQPPFEASARVAWCKPEGNAYLVGVEFLDSDDAFQSRMVQQVCSIENYRKEMEQQGRVLNSQEAAAEWIARFAGQFPTGGDIK
jgi:c-di-GMP-binding flagellar brake protein YcgR